MEERETILDILDELAPGAEVEGCTTLVDDRVLDSLTIVALVAELEDAFDITIPALREALVQRPVPLQPRGARHCDACSATGASSASLWGFCSCCPSWSFW